jgi:hypothetical protein
MRERNHGGMAILARREMHIGSIGDAVQDFGHGLPRTTEKMEDREASRNHGRRGARPMPLTSTTLVIAAPGATFYSTCMAKWGPASLTHRPVAPLLESGAFP